MYFWEKAHFSVKIIVFDILAKRPFRRGIIKAWLQKGAVIFTAPLKGDYLAVSPSIA